MTKVFFYCIIVCFTTLCGYILTKKYRERKLFFNQFSHFNERFINEIIYYKRPIQQFLSNYLYKGKFQEFLEGYWIYLKDKNNEKIALINEYSFLNNEEKRLILDYFSMIGTGDSKSQFNYFSGIKNQLNALKNTSETEHKKYANLYLKLGFLCGLFIVIILI